MHNYKFEQRGTETEDRFRDRVEGYCDGKAVLMITFNHEDDHLVAIVKSFDQL